MAVYKRDIVDINLETGNIHRSFLKHSIGYMDQKADHFGVRVFRDGEPVSLTGVSVQGVFMPPQGDPIAITTGNIVSGNVAEVVLPQACYNYEGQFTLAIKLVDSTNAITGTMRIIDGMVDNTHASGTVAPTSAVPTYQEILATYDAMVAATAATNASLANYYSDLPSSIPAGTYCIYNHVLYRCIAPIASKGAWDASKWVEAKLANDTADLKSAFTDDFNHLKQTDTGDPAFTWELGTFVASTGVELSDNQYLRTVGKLAIDSIRNLTIVNNTGKKMRVGMYLYDGSTFVERVGGQNFEIAVDGSYTYDLTSKNGVVRLTWYYTVKETMQTSYSDNLAFSYETAILAIRRRAFIAERGSVQVGDNANDYKTPGSYNRSSSLDYETDLTNFPPTNESAQLHVLSYGNTLYQLYQTATNLYFRRGTGDWLSIQGMIDDSIQDAFMANAGSLVADFDANTLKIPGSFLKSSSVNVTNLPTQETGIVLDFTNNTNNPCHVEITGTGKLFYRFGTSKKWIMGNASNDYNNRLFKKKIIGIGDSLMYGQGLTPEERASSTWLALLASQFGMTAYNYGLSGSAISSYDETTQGVLSVSTRIDDVVQTHQSETIDYFVVEGGANDSSVVPYLGDLSRDNTDTDTFYGALNHIINKIKEAWPKCRILLMTNYDRKVRNENGPMDENIIDPSDPTKRLKHPDVYYVNAMDDFAHFRGIPVFDNYHDLGVSIRDYYDWSTSTYLDNWVFPIASGQHISVEGYAWMAPIYAKKLGSI